MDDRDPLHPGHGLDEMELAFLIAVVRADERERTAQAIEQMHPDYEGDVLIYRDDAARVAREWRMGDWA